MRKVCILLSSTKAGIRTLVVAPLYPQRYLFLLFLLDRFNDPVCFRSLLIDIFVPSAFMYLVHPASEGILTIILC